MANRKVTVVNPAGYQEQLPDTDHLLIAATPTANTHAVNKLYVDTGLANLDLSSVESDITDLSGRVTTNEGDISSLQTDITTKATKTYVDTQDSTLQGAINTEEAARIAADSSLQTQIDAITFEETQNLQEVTNQGSSTTNDITSTGTITAATLEGDLDYGEY